MKILVYGAGAIGSLFGALLSKYNEVYFIGRKTHVNYVRKHGLNINGKTIFNNKLEYYEDITDFSEKPDLILLTVKSYDTEKAAKQISKIIKKNTIILSLQNGLDNVENIKKYISENNIIAGITSHGSIFIKPGHIKHTGIGLTKIGEINCKKTNRIEKISDLFCKAGIKTNISTNIWEDIWRKAIVNASINPLTAIFQCENGYLLKNTILKKLVSKICIESTLIANSAGYSIEINDMLDFTLQVINDTKKNTSSMLQSVQLKKKTEISSINGVFVTVGNNKGCTKSLNEILVKIVEELY